MSGSEQPDRSPSSYHGTHRASGHSPYDMKARIDALLGAMPPQVREQMEFLARADEPTRTAALAAFDSQTRMAVELILQQMS